MLRVLAASLLIAAAACAAPSVSAAAATPFNTGQANAQRTGAT
jgi:hypothetical protein